MCTSDPSEDNMNTLLFFGHLPFSLKMATISSHGTAPGRSHAAHVLSDREWCILDTVRPPQEKEHSTSVDVAVSNESDTKYHMQIGLHTRDR